MNIFKFISHNRAFKYGIGTYIYEYAQLASKNETIKYNIVQINNSDVDDIQILNKTKNIRYIIFPSKNKYNINSIDGIKDYSRYIICELIKHIKTDENNIFHFNTLHTFYIAKLLREISASPFVYSAHSMEWKFHFNGNYKEFINSWNLKDLARIKPMLNEIEMISMCDKVITVTESIKSFYCNHYGFAPQKFSTIYNGLEKTYNYKQNNKDLARQKLGLKSTDKILLYVGRLDTGKGLEYLFETVKKLKSKNTNFKLFIVGDGEYNKYIKLTSGIWDFINFTGVLTSEYLELFYNASDVGIIPSLYEQCSFVALEMAYYGLPVVYTEVDGLKEIFTDQITGLKIDLLENKSGSLRLSSDQIVEKINSLITDKEKSIEISENLKQLFNNKFGGIRMMNEIEKVYHSLLPIDNN